MFKYLKHHFYENRHPSYYRVVGEDANGFIVACSFYDVEGDLKRKPRAPSFTDMLQQGVNFGKYSPLPLNGCQAAVHEQQLVFDSLDSVANNYKPLVENKQTSNNSNNNE